MKTRIAIDALTIDKNPSGGKTYLINLIEAVADNAGKEFLFYILVQKSSIRQFQRKKLHTNVHFVAFNDFWGKSLPRFFAEQIFLPVWLKYNKIDLIFGRNLIPILSPCAAVVGILSMHLNYEQKNIAWWRRIYGPIILKLSAKRAKSFVAISEYAGKTYIEKFNVPAEKLFIAPCGLTKSFEKVPYTPYDQKYLLFVSSLSPHKNIPFLLRVFYEIRKYRDDLKLVIAGRGNPRNFVELAKGLEIQKEVIFTGAVSDKELAKLYTNAKIFVFPSLIEGFGLTPLEAMSFGLPVVVSDKTSIPEVVGEAGIVLSPDDEKLWAKEILKILENKKLYGELSKKAIERSKQFTWDRAAKITLISYEYALSQE